MPHLTFISVTSTDRSRQERLRKLRNAKTVRMQSFTDHIISREEHAKWIASLNESRKQLAMAVLLGDKLIGAVTLSGIDMRAKSANWSFHIARPYRGKGIGSLVLYKAIKYAFDERGLRKLRGDVLFSNAQSARLHEKLGFILETQKSKSVKKNGRLVGVSRYALSESRWRAVRPRMRKMASTIERRIRDRNSKT